MEGKGICIDKINKKILSKNPKIIIKNLEKYKELYYSGNREREVVYLAALKATKYSELESMLKNNMREERAKELVEEVKSMCSKRRFPEKWWTKEEEDELVLEEVKQESYENGMNYGISQGIIQGETKERKNLIENMFKNDIDISLISKVTNVPINQLKKIKTNLYL